MPEIPANNVRLYYELHGPEDETLVLSNGISDEHSQLGFSPGRWPGMRVLLTIAACGVRTSGGPY